MNEIPAAFSHSKRKQAVLLVFLTFLLIIGTRCLSLRHEMNLHPDEHVFYLSAGSVAYEDGVFKPYKAYPGGAFIFQIPFHLLGKWFTGGAADFSWGDSVLILTGRIASLFYYSIGFLLGAMFLWRCFQNRLSILFFYCLLMVFSLFQIEQSRYGTGDPITFFLLMALLLTLRHFFDSRKLRWYFLAVFIAGALAAVKFPLAFFLLYPLAALILSRRDLSSLRPAVFKLTLTSSLFLFAFSVILFSPQAWTNPGFFMDTLKTEFDIYVRYGNKDVAASPLHHFMSLILYHLLYADFPLALPVALFGGICFSQESAKNRAHRSPWDIFFAIFVPLSLLLFFTYNLFSKTLFMRTYYPFFSLCILYTSYGLSRLFTFQKLRWAVTGLALLMSLRGGYFVYALSQPSQAPLLLNTLAAHENWESRTMTVSYSDYYLTGRAKIPAPYYAFSQATEAFDQKVPVLHPGEFAITGPMDYGFAQKRLFNMTAEEARQTLENWETFKIRNSLYFLGQVYPAHYYPLFGSWILGTTTTIYEFPTNYVYHIPQDAAFAEKARAYRRLSQSTSLDSYLETLADIPDAALILVHLGMDIPFDILDIICEQLSVSSDDMPYDSDILVLHTDGEILFAKALEASAETISLAAALGIDCNVQKKDWHNIITANQRAYHYFQEGYSFILYDLELNQVMDCHSMTWDENGDPALYGGYENDSELISP